jgi:hypothetical protein
VRSILNRDVTIVLIRRRGISVQLTTPVCHTIRVLIVPCGRRIKRMKINLWLGGVILTLTWLWIICGFLLLWEGRVYTVVLGAGLGLIGFAIGTLAAKTFK